MTKKEYFNIISNIETDKSKIERIETLYNRKLPDQLQKIISNSSETVFLDDNTRILSFDEIADAETDLHISFSKKGMIPVADCGENDFIVYHFDDADWSKFNIVDESIFKRKASLDELLK